jgi:hypothetical protein
LRGDKSDKSGEKLVITDREMSEVVTTDMKMAVVAGRLATARGQMAHFGRGKPSRAHDATLGVFTGAIAP